MLTERKSWWGAEVADQSTPQIPPARGGPDERWLREGTGRPHGGSRKPLTPRRPARRLTRLTLISENGEKGYGLRMKSEIPTGWDGFKGTSLNRIKARHLKKKSERMQLSNPLPKSRQTFRAYTGLFIDRGVQECYSLFPGFSSDSYIMPR